MKIEFVAAVDAAEILAVPVHEGRVLAGSAPSLDEKAAGALTITVCGNVKQALTILFGIVLFHVQVGLTNAVGMVVTIAGAVWYSKVELDNKRAKLQAR